MGWERRFGLRELDAFAAAADWPLGGGGLSLGLAQNGRDLWREQLLALAWSGRGADRIRWRLGAEGRRATTGDLRVGAGLLTAGARVESGPLGLGALLRLPVTGEAARTPEGGLVLTLALGGGWRLLWREERTAAGESPGQLALAGRQGAVDWALSWLDGRGLRAALGWSRGSLALDASLWWHPRLPASRRFGMQFGGAEAGP